MNHSNMMERVRGVREGGKEGEGNDERMDK
jgi:hypothetical protein